MKTNNKLLNSFVYDPGGIQTCAISGGRLLISPLPVPAFPHLIGCLSCRISSQKLVCTVQAEIPFDNDQRFFKSVSCVGSFSYWKVLNEYPWTRISSGKSNKEQGITQALNRGERGFLCTKIAREQPPFTGNW